MLISPAVLIDDEEKFLMHNSGYTFYYLKPGLHTFTLKLCDRYDGLAQIQIDTQATQSYFVKVETNFTQGMFGRVFRIVRVADNIGAKEIQECGYLDPSQSGKFSKSYILEDN